MDPHSVECNLHAWLSTQRLLITFDIDKLWLYSQSVLEIIKDWVNACPIQQSLVKTLSQQKQLTGVKHYTEAGYAFVKLYVPEIDVNKPQQASYLAQIAAFHSRTHKHADDLSFIWSDRGSNILVDPARYGYIGRTEIGSDLFNQGFWYSDPKRIYVESTRAHNALEFYGSNYQRKRRKPYGSAICRWTCAKNGIVAIETEVKHFNSIHHVRVLIFMPAQWLIVFDWFNNVLNKPYIARQWFHLAPELSLVQEGQGCLIAVPSSKESLQVIPLLDCMYLSSIYLANEKDTLQGWWSPKEKELIPNYAFYYESKPSIGCIASLFNFSNSLTNNLSWSKANKSGNRARFCWQDENGIHKLYFAREKMCHLEILYNVE